MAQPRVQQSRGKRSWCVPPRDVEVTLHQSALGVHIPKKQICQVIFVVVAKVCSELFLSTWLAGVRFRSGTREPD